MLGWGYGADAVEIAELAEPDQSKIAAIDVNADIQTALENSYAYRLTKKAAHQCQNRQRERRS